MTSTPANASQLPRPITLIINVNSRKGREQFHLAVEALKSAGVAVVEAHAVRNRDESARLLEREVTAGANLVIVGGGDGTISECAGHLINTHVALGVLPLGTGNTFVRSVGIPLDLEGAAQAIAAGHVEAVDVGRANKQVFLNSVSLGLSAEIASALDKRTKKRLGLLAWPVVGTKILWTHRPLLLRITSEEKTFAMRTHQLVIANGRYVAGPIAAAPEASVQDHSFDVFVLGGAKHASLVRTAWHWLRGQHIHTHESRYFSTRRLRVESLRHTIKANVDGEINDETPLDLEILPGALRVVVPHGFEAATV